MTADETGLALLRSELLLPLTELRGDVRLILQRMDQQDARAEEHRRTLDVLDGRVDAVERTTVTREELAQALAQVRRDAEQQQAQQAERARRTLTIWGLVIAAIAAGLTGFGILITLTTR